MSSLRWSNGCIGLHPCPMRAAGPGPVVHADSGGGAGRRPRPASVTHAVPSQPHGPVACIPAAG
jgi:hypothetical protein